MKDPEAERVPPALPAPEASAPLTPGAGVGTARVSAPALGVGLLHRSALHVLPTGEDRLGRGQVVGTHGRQPPLFLGRRG